MFHKGPAQNRKNLKKLLQGGLIKLYLHFGFRWHLSGCGFERYDDNEN